MKSGSVRVAALAAALAAVGPGAAAATGHRLGFGLGVLHAQVRDDLVRALRWDGPGGQIQLRYAHEGERGRHGIEVDLPAALLHDRYGHAAATLGLAAEYRYLHRVGDLGPDAVLRVGGAARWDMALQYYLQWDQEHLYWLTVGELGPAAEYERRVGEHRLAASLALPLAALVSRPPARRDNKIDPLTDGGFLLGRPNEGLEAATLPDAFSVAASVAWRSPRWSDWRLHAAWTGRYRRYARPEPMQTLTHALVVGAERAL